MKEKVLVFIPYQDSDNFYSDGIMTREYAILYLLRNTGYKTVINVKKPRTWLDKKRYQIHKEYYISGTIESRIKEILDESETIQFIQPVSITQLTKRRGWWNTGYRKEIEMLGLQDDKEYLVYSDNPFAVDLLRELHQQNCSIYFDIMDNFAIHPSLNKKEQKMALDGYRQIFDFADYISANSQQTCDYMRNYTDKKIQLVKNGVFINNEINGSITLKEVEIIRDRKKDYKLCVGYIGKLGLRLDTELIDKVTDRCGDVLFVFVGGCLKGQINARLMDLFESRNNILHIESVPSAYVYPILNEFDILSIPHSVGKNENGGDPLKLYQYLTRNKPIITTPILGVNEFRDYIAISDNADEWVLFIESDNKPIKEIDSEAFSWESRISPIIEEIKK